MGWIGTTIGNYSLSIHDSELGYLRNSAPKEYFEKGTVTVHFKMLGTDKEEELKYSLMDFITIKKIKKYYTYGIDNYDMTKMLFDLLKKKQIKVLGDIRLEILSKISGEWNSYFLTSPIGEKLITLNNETPIVVEVKKYEQFRWIVKNGLTFHSHFTKQ